MEGRIAVRLARDLVNLLDRRGRDLGQRDADVRTQDPQWTLARTATEMVPDDAIAAVTGEKGGDARLVAVSTSQGCVYLLEPIKFEPDKSQNASARCRIVAIDRARSSATIESRWWASDEAHRTTSWEICIGPETLKFTTERDFDEEKEPADERLARALCEAAGVPVRKDLEQPMVAVI